MQTTIARSLPPEAYTVVKGKIVVLTENSTGAGIIGFGLLLYAASTVFTVLNHFVQKIWRVNPQVSLQGTVVTIACRRFLSISYFVPVVFL